MRETLIPGWKGFDKLGSWRQDKGQAACVAAFLAAIACEPIDEKLRKAVKKRSWGSPGQTWMPGVDHPED